MNDATAEIVSALIRSRAQSFSIGLAVPSNLRTPLAIGIAFAFACDRPPTPPKPPAQGLDPIMTNEGGSPNRLRAVERESFVVTDGSVTTGPLTLSIRAPEVRAVVPRTFSDAAEIRFIYRGPSVATSPLASGEIRRQIGIKLRAQDTCNLVYVMWHVEPTQGVAVSVKSNPGRSTHEQCGANGYVNVKPATYVAPPAIAIGEPHVLHSQIEGTTLKVTADHILVWQGDLGDTATMTGPAGIRSDNGQFDFDFFARVE